MKNFIKASCFIIIGLVILHILNIFYNPVESTQEQWFNPVKDFYNKDKDTIDILYLGDSNVYAGVSPLEIYEKIGVTGYAYSTPIQEVWSSYYLLKEALKTQKPKVVFLETGEFFSKPDGYQPEYSKRNPIDAMKFSLNKLEMINDNDYRMSNYDKLTCVFPILRYHSRWSKMTENDVRKMINHEEHSYEGNPLNPNIKSYKEEQKDKKNDRKNEKNDSNKISISKEALEKIDKMIKLCSKNNCQLILITMPTPTGLNTEQNDTIQKFADDNNLKFIDLNNTPDVQIDWDKDAADTTVHLNIYGAEKVANYLTDYIKTNFNIPDHRQDAKYERWNEDLEKYNNDKIKWKVNQ